MRITVQLQSGGSLKGSAPPSETVDDMMRRLKLQQDLVLVKDQQGPHLALSATLADSNIATGAKLWAVHAGHKCADGHTLRRSNFSAGMYWGGWVCNSCDASRDGCRWVCPFCVHIGGVDICDECTPAWKVKVDRLDAAAHRWKKWRNELRARFGTREYVPSGKVFDNLCERSLRNLDPGLPLPKNVPEDIVYDALTRARSHGGRAVSKLHKLHSELGTSAWDQYCRRTVVKHDESPLRHRPGSPPKVRSRSSSPGHHMQTPTHTSTSRLGSGSPVRRAPDLDIGPAATSRQLAHERSSPSQRRRMRAKQRVSDVDVLQSSPGKLHTDVNRSKALSPPLRLGELSRMKVDVSDAADGVQELAQMFPHVDFGSLSVVLEMTSGDVAAAATFLIGTPRGDAGSTNSQNDTETRLAKLMQLYWVFDSMDNGSVPASQLALLAAGDWTVQNSTELLNHMAIRSDGTVLQREFAQVFEQALPMGPKQFNTTITAFTRIAQVCRQQNGRRGS